LEIELFPCKGKPECKTREEQEEFFTRQRLYIPYINSYVNLNNYTEVIQQYADEDDFYTVDLDVVRELDLLVKRNNLVDNDHYIQWGDTKTETFFSIENTRFYTSTRDMEYIFKIYILLDRKQD